MNFQTLYRLKEINTCSNTRFEIPNMKNLLLFTSAVLIISACSTGFQKSPVDQLILQLEDEPVYTILLYDLDVKGGLSKTYLHRYRVITERNGEPNEVKTEWMEVSPHFFMRHQNDLGMELASKNTEGTINKVPAPPGYGNYVGNEKYGQWVNRNGSSFWEFYGKFAMLNTVFNLMSSPVNYRYYNDYRYNYRGRRPYYGTRDRYGQYGYGTNSRYTRATRSGSGSSNFFQRKQQQTGWKSSSANKVERTRTSSYRSRGGGFGK